MTKEIIVLKQLPLIEERLDEIKAAITERTSEAMAIECTEENRQYAKSLRAKLNKEFKEIDQKRTEVKKEYMADWDRFMESYSECANIYKEADTALKEKIDEVENGLKKRKAEALKKYYEEKRTALNIDARFAFEDVGFKITLSTSEKALREEADAYLDKVRVNVERISTMENADEIMCEYLNLKDYAKAVLTVQKRHERIEAEAKARENREALETAQKEHIAEVLTAVRETAKKEADEAPKTFKVSFIVYGTMEQLKALKHFLKDGGYKFENE